MVPSNWCAITKDKEVGNEGNEVEDVGVDKIYLDSAVIVHLR